MPTFCTRKTKKPLFKQIIANSFLGNYADYLCYVGKINRVGGFRGFAALHITYACYRLKVI